MVTQSENWSVEQSSNSSQDILYHFQTHAPGRDVNQKGFITSQNDLCHVTSSYIGRKLKISLDS